MKSILSLTIRVICGSYVLTLMIEIAWDLELEIWDFARRRLRFRARN